MPVMAEDLVLRARANDVRVTDLCSNCTPKNLHLAYWTIYKAKVKEVVAGTFDAKYVHFAYAQHAQHTRRVLKDFTVKLVPASVWLKEHTQADYEVVELDFPSLEEPN